MAPIRKWRWPVALLLLLVFGGSYFLEGTSANLFRRSILSIQLTPSLSHGGLKWVLVFLFLVIALAIGRAYCSILCPAGLVQELFLRFGRRLRLLKLRRAPPGYPGLFLLILALLGMAGSMAAANWLDPAGLFGRLAAPAGGWWRREGTFLPGILPLLSILVFTAGAVALVIVPLFRGRWFCGRLCPVGMLLGIFSATKGRRLVIDGERCISCGECEKVCQTCCIDAGAKTIDPSRCVICLDCVGACKLSAVLFAEHRPEGRRNFFRSAFGFMAGGLYVFSRRFGEGLGSENGDGTPDIPPPGAVSLANYKQNCVSCQACVAACPSGIIQPGNPEMRPILNYDIGFCQYECVACTYSCPAGVLRPLPLEEKLRTRIAGITMHRERCVVLTQGEACGACAEVCPTHAVIMVKQKDAGLPTLPDYAAEYCLGCGACHFVCPVEPRVFSVSTLAKPEKTQGLRPLDHSPANAPAAGFGGKLENGLTDFPF